MYKKKSHNEEALAKYLFPKAEVLIRLLKYMVIGLKVRRVFSQFQKILLVRSAVEIFLILFGIWMFFARSFGMWYIFMHSLHLLSGITGLISWHFLNFNMFFDLMEDFPIEKR